MSQVKQEEGSRVVVQGRIVWGSLEMHHRKNYTSKQPEFNQKGEPVMECSFGLAVPKPTPTSSEAEIANFNGIWTAIHTEAGKQGFQHPNAKFAFKFIDGDGKKDDGSAYPKHSHGCIVVACSTRLPLSVGGWNNVGQEIQLSPKDVESGDYVIVNLLIKGHPAPNAGLYTNPAIVGLIQKGERIVSAPTVGQAFGMQRPAAIPTFAAQIQEQAASAPPSMMVPPVLTNPGVPSMGQTMAVPQYQPNIAVLPPQFQQPAQAPVQMFQVPSFPVPGQ